MNKGLELIIDETIGFNSMYITEIVEYIKKKKFHYKTKIKGLSKAKKRLSLLLPFSTYISASVSSYFSKKKLKKEREGLILGLTSLNKIVGNYQDPVDLNYDKTTKKERDELRDDPKNQLALDFKYSICDLSKFSKKLEQLSIQDDLELKTEIQEVLSQINSYEIALTKSYEEQILKKKGFHSIIGCMLVFGCITAIDNLENGKYYKFKSLNSAYSCQFRTPTSLAENAQFEITLSTGLSTISPILSGAYIALSDEKFKIQNYSVNCSDKKIGSSIKFTSNLPKPIIANPNNQEFVKKITPQIQSETNRKLNEIKILLNKN